MVDPQPSQTSHVSVLSPSRELYDQDYFDQDCPRAMYDTNTAVDNLFWTYVTSYGVAGLSLLIGCTLFLLQFRRRWKRESKRNLVADGDSESQASEELPMFHLFCNPDSQIHPNMEQSIQSPEAIQPPTEQAQSKRQRSKRKFLSPDLPSNLPPAYYHLLVTFFGLMTLGFGAAGAHQQFVESKNDEDNVYMKVLEYSSAAFIGFTCWIWMAVALLEYHVAIKGRDVRDLTNHGLVKWLLKLLAVGAVAAMLVLESKLILGALMVLAIALNMTMSIWQYVRYHHALFLSDAVAPVWYLGAVVVFGLLDHVCGESAYKECFEDCPLPKPDVFNHKAFFGVGCCAFVIHYGVDKIAMQLKSTSSPLPAQNAPYKNKPEPSELL